MASILGAPAELTRDFIDAIEPLARALCPAEAAELDSCNLGELEAPSAPYVDSSRAIVRAQAAELTRQSFKEQLWKLDKPAIITGLLQLWRWQWLLPRQSTPRAGLVARSGRHCGVPRTPGTAEALLD